MGTHPLAARAALLGAIAIGAVLFSSPSSSGKSELTVPEISVRHFHTLLPQALAIGGDGSVWMTDKYYGISRLRPDGHLKSYSFGADRYSDFAVDLVTGPDGAIWFAATDTVGRIDPEGATPIRTWPVGPGWMAYAITSAYGALWFTNEGAPARIGRLTTTGAITNFKLGGRWSYELPGITAGPAGSIWFTQLGYYRDPADAIGRISAEGRYAHWRLPDRRAHPLRIAAGPDGNLWFTEQHAHAIGRITPTGEIRNFPLPNGLSPYGIVAGLDGALWFTANSCVGRITTSGAIATWSLPKAGELLGIAAASDGSFWLTDDIGGALWHFGPPLDGRSSARCAPPTLVRRSHATSATLVYDRLDRGRGYEEFTDARISIARRGKTLYHELVPSFPEPGADYGSPVGLTSGLAIRDLDGYGEPEALLDLNWNGVHCCEWTRIYRYERSRQRYVSFNHMWGNDGATPQLRDLNGDGRVEFVSLDDRFAYDFGGYAGSVDPIQIWTYERGRLRVTTRQFPRQVAAQARSIWRLYLRTRGRRNDDSRGLLAAWAADEYLLGKGSLVWPTLELARKQGYLRRCQAGGCLDPGGEEYIKAVRRLLQKTGYLRR